MAGLKREEIAASSASSSSASSSASGPSSSKSASFSMSASSSPDVAHACPINESIRVFFRDQLWIDESMSYICQFMRSPAYENRIYDNYQVHFKEHADLLKESTELQTVLDGLAPVIAKNQEAHMRLVEQLNNLSRQKEKKLAEHEVASTDRQPYTKMDLDELEAQCRRLKAHVKAQEIINEDHQRVSNKMAVTIDEINQRLKELSANRHVIFVRNRMRQAAAIIRTQNEHLEKQYTLITTAGHDVKRLSDAACLTKAAFAAKYPDHADLQASLKKRYEQATAVKREAQKGFDTARDFDKEADGLIVEDYKLLVSTFHYQLATCKRDKAGTLANLAITYFEDHSYGEQKNLMLALIKIYSGINALAAARERIISPLSRIPTRIEADAYMKEGTHFRMFHYQAEPSRGSLKAKAEGINVINLQVYEDTLEKLLPSLANVVGMIEASCKTTTAALEVESGAGIPNFIKGLNGCLKTAQQELKNIETLKTSLSLAATDSSPMAPAG